MPNITTLTDILDPDEPREISWKHHVPMWAYPQLEFLRKTFPNQFIITNLTHDSNNSNDSALIVRIYMKSDQTYYIFHIYKRHMNAPEFVPWIFEAP